MDSTEQSPAILSLCSGMLGLDRGVERAIGQIRTVAYVEIEAVVAWNLVSQMEKGILAPAPVFTNVKTFAGIAHHFRGKIHGITGGYPCQPFSVAGKRKGTEDPRHLWPYIKTIVSAVEPIWCFFENVPGHLTLGFEQVKQELEQLHYRVEAGIFSAEEVGTPHRRERLFILAIKMDHAGSLGFKQNDKVSARGYRPESSGKELADSNDKGSQGRHNDIMPECTGEFIIRQSYTQTRWPARPGEIQYEWEEPRTKSRMGFTVNGYNFREDLLRMGGNGVVPEAAELAFITLYKKFQ